MRASILERAGDYPLPAVEIPWRDLGGGRIRTASVPAESLSVAPAPVRADKIRLPDDATARAPSLVEPRQARSAAVPRWSAPELVRHPLAGAPPSGAASENPLNPPAWSCSDPDRSGRASTDP